jgi:multiple sugar transport system ATP-binding protein
MLHEGQVVQVASPKDLYDQPVDLRTAIFVGSPPINLFKGVFDAGSLRFVGLNCPCPQPLTNVLSAAKGEFTVGLRPENATIVLPPDEPKNGESVGAAPLVDIEPLGRTLAVTLKLNGELLTTLASTAVLERLTLGQELKFKIKDPSAILAFRPDGRNYLA